MFLVCTGALQAIPKELTEAAAIDGAGAGARLRRVTMPHPLGGLLITYEDVTDALAVEADGRRMTGRKPLSAYSYFGQQAPPRGFRVALMSEVRPGAELRFMIFGDKAGQYARLEGEGAVAAALGKTLLAATYRDCEKRALEPAPRAVAEPLERRAPDLLADPAFRSAYLKALGPRARERWLARMDGPSPALRQVRVEGAEYTLVAVCKAHDCGDNNMVALYSPAGRQVFGKILEGGSRSTLIGSPSPAMAAELERLWAGEWRQGQ